MFITSTVENVSCNLSSTHVLGSHALFAIARIHKVNNSIDMNHLQAFLEFNQAWAIKFDEAERMMESSLGLSLNSFAASRHEPESVRGPESNRVAPSGGLFVRSEVGEMVATVKSPQAGSEVLASIGGVRFVSVDRGWQRDSPRWEDTFALAQVRGCRVRLIPLLEADLPSQLRGSFEIDEFLFSGSLRYSVLKTLNWPLYLKPKPALNFSAMRVSQPHFKLEAVDLRPSNPRHLTVPPLLFEVKATKLGCKFQERAYYPRGSDVPESELYSDACCNPLAYDTKIGILGDTKVVLTVDVVDYVAKFVHELLDQLRQEKAVVDVHFNAVARRSGYSGHSRAGMDSVSDAGDMGGRGAGGGGTKSWRDRVQPFVGDGQVSDGSLVVDVASLSLKVYQQKVEEDDK